jgi:clan AA aspartic protease (TIGR02281 family)
MKALHLLVLPIILLATTGATGEPKPVVPVAGAPDSITAGANASGPEDIFKAKGLSKVGFLLITAREAEIHAAANSVRALKYKVATEISARAGLSKAVDAAAAVVEKLDAELARIDQQMQKAKKNVAEHNRLVEPYNTTLREYKQRKAALDELRRKMAKIEDSQERLTELTTSSVRQADAALAAYAAMEKDPVLKSAIDNYNKHAPQQIKLGPSGAFSGDAGFLKKFAAEMIADGVPARMDGGVPVVAVTINGTTRDMIWDSGASYLSLSSETAAEFGLHATASDRTVMTTIADGRQVAHQLIVVPAVRVGPFIAENVECLISPPGPNRKPDLLGGSFQRHFICRLDQQAGVIHLTPISQVAITTQPSPPQVASGPPAAPPSVAKPPSIATPVPPAANPAQPPTTLFPPPEPSSPPAHAPATPASPPAPAPPIPAPAAPAPRPAAPPHPARRPLRSVCNQLHRPQSRRLAASRSRGG